MQRVLYKKKVFFLMTTIFPVDNVSLLPIKTIYDTTALGYIGYYPHGLTVEESIVSWFTIIEPRREKTGFLHMRKQRRRSAAQ